MRIQGIKAALVWNMVRGEELEAIDLEARKTVDIAKVIITPENIEKIKDKFPDVYDRFVDLFKDPDHSFFGTSSQYGVKIKKTITSIAIPTDVQVPEWLVEFIDYTTIINNNLTNFPTESVNIVTMDNPNVNFTNIMKI